jgi:hypothetical protein
MRAQGAPGSPDRCRKGGGGAGGNTAPGPARGPLNAAAPHGLCHAQGGGGGAHTGARRNRWACRSRREGGGYR